MRPRLIRWLAGGRSWPRGLLGMVALIAAVEVGVVLRNDLRLTERIPHRWSYAGREARGPEAIGADVLCLGDSQILLGLVPSLIDARSGRSAFNLAVPGGQSPSTYFLFRRALEAGARPEALVVGFFPGLLSINGVANLRHWPELLDTRETLDLALASGSPPLLVRITLARLLPSIRKRDEIRDRIVGALGGEPNTTLEVVLAYRRNWRINRGAQLAPAGEEFIDAVGEEDRGQVGDLPWRPDPTNAAYVERLLTLAARHGTTVVWVMPTTSPAWQEFRDDAGLDHDYERYARSLASRYPNLVVVDGRRSGYDVTAFRDAFHLERRGAAALSTDLGELLGRLLDPGAEETSRQPSMAGAAIEDRWLSLPAYSVRSIHRGLEDVEQSRRALAVADPGRRRR